MPAATALAAMPCIRSFIIFDPCHTNNRMLRLANRKHYGNLSNLILDEFRGSKNFFTSRAAAESYVTLLGKKGNGKVSKNVLFSQNLGFDLQGISFFKISLDQRHYLPNQNVF